ncbi:MAG: prepilin-type N-terminal cleavage/methylation domain-containing protein [Rhodocyclaceae bacterium]|nr:prepilin-type N-terminal cleavage/methylation domain-containing protein [Rhodocyclaceae bacterium]
MNALSRGFSLVELMIGLVLLGVLIAIGLPSMRAYSVNSKILALAQSYQASVQQARSHAVLVNSNVDVVLTSAIPTAANVAATASATGPNWIVRVQPNPDAPPPVAPITASNPATVLTDAYVFVEGRGGSDDTTSAGLAAVDINSSVGTFNGVTYDDAKLITFSGLSNAASLLKSAAVQFSASATSGLACAPTGPIRCLMVVIAPGGQSKVCDPAATTVGDNRSCT